MQAFHVSEGLIAAGQALRRYALPEDLAKAARLVVRGTVTVVEALTPASRPWDDAGRVTMKEDAGGHFSILDPWSSQAHRR